MSGDGQHYAHASGMPYPNGIQARGGIPGMPQGRYQNPGMPMGANPQSIGNRPPMQGMGNLQRTSSQGGSRGNVPQMPMPQPHPPSQGDVISLLNRDSADFPSLPHSFPNRSITPNSAQAEFTMHNEDFPALPATNTPNPRDSQPPSFQKNPSSSSSSSSVNPNQSQLPVNQSQSQPQSQSQNPSQSLSQSQNPNSSQNPSSLNPSSNPSPNPNQNQTSLHSNLPGSRPDLQDYIQNPSAKSEKAPNGQHIDSSKQLEQQKQRGTMKTSERYGLLGLLGVIRMTEPDLNTLAIGSDLTTLGLNLNSPECIYSTFASPWTDTPSRKDPEFKLPNCYIQSPLPSPVSKISSFTDETLFYIFYSMPKETLQDSASQELYKRGWRFHKTYQVWVTRDGSLEVTAKTSTYERGSYIVFDVLSWEKARKDLTLVYDQLEERPPSNHR